MPAVPFIAVALGASGAFAAVGATLASVIGISTVPTVAATAIGAGAFAGAVTAVSGGSASDVLKSAVLGGVTSYAGSAIAGSIGASVESAATGFDPGIASAMGKVAGSAVAGAISSGTSALLSNRDPIDALLKGGLTAAMSAGVGAGVDALLKDVSAFSTPLNNQEAALQRATKAAIGTAIVSGGNPDAIGISILNSFAATAGRTIGNQIRDTSSQLSTANEQFGASERAYTNNLEQQNKLVSDYNSQIAPLQQSSDKVNDLIKQYDEVSKNYNNYDSWMKSQGYEQRAYGTEDSWENYWVKRGELLEKNALFTGIDDWGYPVSWRQDRYAPDQFAPDSISKDALYKQAKAIDAQAVAESNAFNELKIKLLGGEVTKYRTETVTKYAGSYDWDGNYIETPYTEQVQVPYKETVTGSLTPIKDQLDNLKTQNESLGQNFVSAKTNLEKAVENFNITETANAAVVDQQIKNFTTASSRYKAEFGVDPTEEQLTNFASTGDILGHVSKLVADNNNEQAAVAAGYKNYADFTAAGNIAPNDFYAKQEGWSDYAQKLNAQANGYNAPSAWNTHINNQQTAVDNGFTNYQDYQAAAGTTSNDFYAKKEGWTNYAEKSQATDAGFKNPTTWNTHVTDVKNQESAKAAGFPDYATQQKYGGNLEELQANQQGWANNSEKINAANTGITSPQKWQEFLSGKTEEDKIVQMLRDRGIPATPERVADVMRAWDFSPSTPNVGFTEALDKSDKLNISNARADSVQEAAALAKSLGYSNFAFGGSEYKINPQTTTTNAYDFFASFGEAYKAARADLGAGKNFEWTNPATGQTKTFNTNNEKEQAVADQKRIDLMPAYTGEGAYTRNGNPGIVDNIFYDKNSNNVVQDNRVWDQDGKLVSGEVKNINPDASGSAAERVAASLKESFGKTFDAFKYVTSGINKGGWELLNQVGVLGGLTGLVDMDNWATKTAADMKKVIDGYQNKEFLNNRSLMNSAIAKAGNEGIFAQAVEAGKQFGLNPLQTAEFIAQQGASLFLGGGAMATARALGAGLTAQQAATIGTMAVAQGASVADQAYRDGLKNNKTPEEALNAARVAWAGSALTSAIANKFIPGALSNEAAIASQNIAKASLSTALRGEMSSELAENTSGQIIANIAAGNPWDKNLGSTIIQSIVASGAITGLVNVSTTGNPETAIEIAKDSGLSNNEIENIRSNFQKAIDEIKIQTQSGQKVDSYDISVAVENLSDALRTTGLSSNAIAQVQDLIATDATQNAVRASLEESGVPSEFANSIASQSATKILEGASFDSLFGDLSTILQANGFSPLDANLITNETLTGTDVKQVVTDQLKAAGYNPTQAEVNNLISQNASANPVDIGESVSSYVEPRLITKEEASEALVSAGISNPSEEQINTLVGQYDQNLLQSRADTTAGDISTQLSSAEKASFERDAALSKTLNDISAQMTANQNSGMNADQALSNAIEKVATDAGTTKQELLGQIGTTEQGLKNDIASLQQKTTQDIAGVQTQIGNVQESLTKAISDARAAGLQGDQALQSGIDSVAANLGVTKDALLAQVGKSEEQLRSEMQTGQQQTTQQISDLNKSLSDRIAANEAAGLTRDQATAKAIEDVATSLGTTKDALLSQLGTTEQTLRTELQSGLADVTKTFQDQYNNLSAAQKAQFDAMVEQGASTQAALAEVQRGLQEQITTGQAEAASNIADVKKSLGDQIAANEAAGLSRDEATNKAVQDVATNLGKTKEELLGQIGETEQNLRDLYAKGQEQTTKSIADLDSATKSKFDALTQEQKTQALALAESTKDLQGSINSVAQQVVTGQQQTAQSIANLDASTKAKFDALTQEQQSQALALANSTKDLQGSIDTVAQQTTQQITNVQTTLQNQLAQQNTQTQQAFASMNAAQQKEVADRVAQGEGLTKAIGDVSGQVTGLGGQVTALQAELAAQKAAEDAYRKEQEEKAAQDAAKAAQSAARAAASSRMSTQAGVLSGLAGIAGLAGAAAVSDEEFKPLQGTFLTSKGGQSGYKGLLQDFQQEVEGQPNMADNTMGRQESNDMAPYYSYGNETSLGQILGQENDQQQFFASGGLATPLMAAGGAAGTRYGKYAAGGMPSPLMAAGGKMRVDFRKGDAVTGPGDGQSDDIPAMLADGEYVFDAETVSALGNGSTKAGSQLLDEFRRQIRMHKRGGSLDTIPPKSKSPLSYLAQAKKKLKKS